MDTGLAAAINDVGLAKVGLRLTRWMVQRHKYLTHPQLPQHHITAHNRIAARETVFVLQSLQDTLGGVALLLDERFIVFEYLVNDTRESIQFRRNGGCFAPITRR